MSDDSGTRLYLLRHGEAKSKDEDPNRALTARGADDVTRMAIWAARADISVDAIRHSGKLRAQQTAEIFSEHLPDGPVPQAVSGLGPNDDVQTVAQPIQRENRPILLVGHLPFLERLASWLVAGDPNASVVTLDAAALLVLVNREDGWSVASLMQPELLPRP